MVLALTLRSYYHYFFYISFSVFCFLKVPFYIYTNLNIDLVTAKNNGNVFTNTDEITMPVRYVLVGDSGSNIKHDDGTLTANTIIKNISFLLSLLLFLLLLLLLLLFAKKKKKYLLITITKTTKLFLTGSIPSVENNSTKVGVEGKRMYLNTKSSYLT